MEITEQGILEMYNQLYAALTEVVETIYSAIETVITHLTNQGYTIEEVKGLLLND